MRCKACDNLMTEKEIIWNEEIQDHEPLCRECRDALRDDEDLEIVYEDEIIDYSILILGGHDDES